MTWVSSLAVSTKHLMALASSDEYVPGPGASTFVLTCDWFPRRHSGGRGRVWEAGRRRRRDGSRHVATLCCLRELARARKTPSRGSGGKEEGAGGAFAAP